MRLMPFRPIEIDDGEVLRYLKSREDSALLTDIKAAKQRLQTVLSPAAAAAAFPLQKENSELYCGELLLQGNSIKKHLSGCKSCVAMALTLGFGADRLIASLGQTDPYGALLLDACATAAVEDLADQITERARESYCPNKKITYRFSPGYGDLPLSLQPQLLDLIDARRQLGLTVSASMLLSPIKSVTAFFGVFDEECGGAAPKHDCSSCFMQGDCPYCKQTTKG